MQLRVLSFASMIVMGAQSAAAQVPPILFDPVKVVGFAADIATKILVIDMCKLDMKQMVDDGNVVLSFVKEFHPTGYERAWKQAREALKTAEQQSAATCEGAADSYPKTARYYSTLAGQIRPLLNK